MYFLKLYVIIKQIIQCEALFLTINKEGFILNRENVVAIYVRLSKEDLESHEKESESIQNQKSMLINYAVNQHWQISNIYCDEDYSGAYSGEENDRPEFNKMISDASIGKFNIVLCKTQSRFSRNMEVIEQYIHGKFLEWGIRFVSIVDNADTNVKGNKKARQINSLINEWYLEDLSENIKAVYLDKMRKGEFLAAFPPYGYNKDKTTKNHLVVNAETSQIVKQIYAWNIEGYGAAKICRMLNNRGIPNPRKQQELDGLRKTLMYTPEDMGTWTTTTIGDILHNQVYCGDVVQHTKEKVSYKSKLIKKIPEDEIIIVHDMHEPIISRDVYEQVQKNLAMKRKATGTGKPHLLSGKVFCHYCGKMMQKNHGVSCKAGHIGYLRCRDKYSYCDEKKCQTPNIRIDFIVKEIQMELINKFKKEYSQECDIEKVTKLLNRSSPQYEHLISQKETLNQKKQTLQQSQKTLYFDKINSVISVEQFMEYNNDIINQIKKLDRDIENIEHELSNIKSHKNSHENTVKQVIGFFENYNIDRDIVEAVINKIEFGEKDQETGQYLLKIFWAWD